MGSRYPALDFLQVTGMRPETKTGKARLQGFNTQHFFSEPGNHSTAPGMAQAGGTALTVDRSIVGFQD